MPALSNLCRFFTSTTGTGTLTIGAAVPGFLTPAQAGHSNGDVVFYAIADGTNSECGTGTYTSSGPTLSRSPVTSTGSGFNSAINLSGSGVQIFITPIASAITISGGLTAGTIPKASAASTLVNGSIVDSSGSIGIGTASPISKITLSGASGQTTAAFNTGGTLSDVITLDSQGTGGGNGGAILFSAASGAWRFATIKGLVTNGGNNSQGEISFSTRRVDTDSTLTQAMKITSAGELLAYNSIVGIGLGPSGNKGQIRLAANSGGTLYGTLIYNDGTNFYLLLTANNDPFGGYNTLRPFVVSGSTGFITMDCGLQINSSAIKGLSIVNGSNSLVIYDDTQEHIEASTALHINSGSHAGINLYGVVTAVNAAIATNGANGAFFFNDRSGASPTTWGWYAQGGFAILYNNVNGDRISVDAAGSVTISGNFSLPNNTGIYFKDTGGTNRFTFGLVSDNRIWIGDGLRNVVLNGHMVPVADNTFYLGVGGFSWSNVNSYLYNGVSDMRLKTDFSSLPKDCLDLVKKIVPVAFRWREGRDTKTAHWGFIAQDVKRVMDKAGIDFGGHSVGDDPRQTEALSITDMIALLWRAVQQLSEAVKVK